MKITLINPPFDDETAVGSSGSMRGVLNIIPPLGLASCAAVLERAGFEASVADCAVERDILGRLADEAPDIVGITSTTPVFKNACALAAAVRGILPRAVLVLGGPHVTAMPRDAMGSGLFDVGVVGEGEESLRELAGHIARTGLNGVAAIPGLVVRAGGSFVTTARRDFIRDLDGLPYPARHLLPPLSAYHPTPASYKRLPLGVIISSRGCPHRCTFCDRSVFGNSWRQRSAENVLGEVSELVGSYGAREIRFFDDCFALDKARVSRICAGFRKMGKKIPWSCLTTVGSVTRELLADMRSAGCWQVLFGLESGDDRMLRLLCKGASVAQNTQAVRWARQAGLSVRADFIVGTPGETEESLEKTLSFALRSGVDYAHFNKFVPYPGTELYSRLIAQGYEFSFGKGASITAHSEFLYIPETIIDKKAYMKFINRAHRKFYLRISYIARRLLSIRSWEELAGQARGLIAIMLLRTGGHVCVTKK